jgi:putative ABC transport system permease protein
MTLLADISHAFRALRRMPALAAVVVLSLGIGIGVNTTVFSWIQLVILQPLPGVADARRFHFIEPRADTGSYPGVSWLEYQDLRERLQAVTDPLAFRMVPFNVGESGRTERTYGLLVSGNYFSALGLQPALGRFLRPDEVARAGGEPVAVVSHGYWQTRLGGAADAIGRTLRVNDQTVTIVGVAPERFQGTVLALSFDLWMPATLAPALFTGSKELEERSQRGYGVLARLPSAAARVQAQAELDRAMRELAQLYPATNAGIGGDVLPFWQAPRGPQRLLGEALLILQGVMLLLLLAVCANTANLMLARASARQREVGVRLALGAGPWRIVSLFLAENLVLALLGAAVGLLFAVWGTNALRAVPFIGAFPIRFQTEVDAGGLLFAILLGLVCGVVFGIAPAAQLARVDPQAALRSGARTAVRSRMRHVLMGAEVAVALVVLMSGGLFLRSFAITREIDPGFRREGVLLASYELSSRNLDSAGAGLFAARLLERLRRLPDVEAAAIATQVPLDIHGLPLRGFTLEGRPANEQAPDRALSNVVTPGYFTTMGIPLLRGRPFTAADSDTSPPVVIINDAAARRFWSADDPIGQRISLGSPPRWMEIVGIVGDIRHIGLDADANPEAYMPYRQGFNALGSGLVRALTVVVRADMETAAVAPMFRTAVAAIDPEQPVGLVRPMDELIADSVAPRRLNFILVTAFACVALVLTAAGLYGVMAYLVSQRTREIGVRMALGASPGQVLGLVMRQAGTMTIAGIALGIAGALALTRSMSSLLFGVSAADPTIYLAVSALLALVAFAAVTVPSLRATRVDPLIALREG